MTVLITILCVLGWAYGIFMFVMFKALARVYVAQRMEIELLNQQLSQRPTNWNQWIPPYE